MHFQIHLQRVGQSQWFRLSTCTDDSVGPSGKRGQNAVHFGQQDL